MYISFTSEVEKDSTLPFLDVNVIRDGNVFSTSVYKKPTFSGVYTNFVSFLPDEYKRGLIYTLLFRIFSIVSDYSKFHLEVQKLREVMLKNGYPSSFFDKYVKSFLTRIFKVKTIKATVERKELLLVLPYLGAASLQLRTKLENAISKNLPFCKLRVVFKTGRTLGSFFQF